MTPMHPNPKSKIQNLKSAALWLCTAYPVFAQPLDGREVTEDIFYHFMPIAWRDSNNDAQRFGDFGGMTASLDYLEDLGVTAIWMNPIFPSAAYHGYQHGDASQINPWFGNEAGFLNFVQQAHARGIKVFIDFVVYGVSHNSIWYQGAFSDPDSPYDPWLAFTNPGNTSYLGYTFTTWNGSSVGFIHWNLNNANANDLIVDWSLHWLDPNGDGDPSDGIDGYRLDHVSAFHPDESPWGYDIDWWVDWKNELLTVNPDVFTFAEQADWGSHGADLLPAHDAAMTKPWEFAVRDGLAAGLAQGIYDQTAVTLASLPPGRVFLGSVNDHDVDRLASVIGGGASNLIKCKAAAAIHLTAPFPPVIYYGDEIGMRGTKGNWSTDSVDIPMREPFKWNAVAGPPMSNYWILNAQAYNNRFAQNNDGRSVQEQDGVAGSLLETYKTLIAARKAEIALRRGAYAAVTNSSTAVFSFLRYLPESSQDTLLVAIRLNSTSASPTFNLSDTVIPGGSTTVRDVITGQFLADLTDANKSAYSLSVPSYGFRILSVNLTVPPPPANPIDGVDIPESLGGGLIATQNNATGLGDNISELNQMFVRSEANGIRMGLTGNLATDGTGLVLLFDTQSGGQNLLTTAGYPSPGAVAAMNGLRLDAGFAPDRLIFVNTFGGGIYVDHFTLPTSGATTKTYKGSGTVNDGDGFLSGGTNPNGMQVAMNNTNALGVTATDPSGAATAANGFDMFLPFADLGVTGGPNGTIGAVAFIVQSNGNVSNQWLPGLGGGHPNLGLAPNMTTISGTQYAMVPLGIPGDWDGDGDVDLADYAAWPGCMTGPDNGPPSAGCAPFDFDLDADVDLTDYAAFTDRD